MGVDGDIFAAGSTSPNRDSREAVSFSCMVSSTSFSLIKGRMESDERDKDRGNISKSPSISFDEARRFDGFSSPLPEGLERDNDKDKNRGAS